MAKSLSGHLGHLRRIWPSSKMAKLSRRWPCISRRWPKGGDRASWAPSLGPPSRKNRGAPARPFSSESALPPVQMGGVSARRSARLSGPFGHWKCGSGRQIRLDSGAGFPPENVKGRAGYQPPRHAQRILFNRLRARCARLVRAFRLLAGGSAEEFRAPRITGMALPPSGNFHSPLIERVHPVVLIAPARAGRKGVGGRRGVHLSFYRMRHPRGSLPSRETPSVSAERRLEGTRR